LNPKVHFSSICILRSLIFISWCVDLASLYVRACDCGWKELASTKSYGQLFVIHCQRIIQTLESSVCIHTRHLAQNHKVIPYFRLPLVLSSDQNPSRYPMFKLSLCSLFLSLPRKFHESVFPVSVQMRESFSSPLHKSKWDMIPTFQLKSDRLLTH